MQNGHFGDHLGFVYVLWTSQEALLKTSARWACIQFVTSWIESLGSGTVYILETTVPRLCFAKCFVLHLSSCVLVPLHLPLSRSSNLMVFDCIGLAIAAPSLISTLSPSETWSRLFMEICGLQQTCILCSWQETCCFFSFFLSSIVPALNKSYHPNLISLQNNYATLKE